MNNQNKQDNPKVEHPTARDYLKSKGLKNPPLDSGISGGGDAPRRYASDMMEEWSRLNGKFRDKAVSVAYQRITELENDLNESNDMYDKDIELLRGKISELEGREKEYEIAISRLLKGDYDVTDISLRFPHL